MPYEIKTPGPQRGLWDLIWNSGLKCRCPRCADAPLFTGISRVRPGCESCGLDFSAEDAGDGPAPFLTMILGAVFVILAMWYEFSFDPPIWHHILLWAPLIIIANILLLRPMKSLMIALQYRFAAGERLSDDGSEWQSDDK